MSPVIEMTSNAPYDHAAALERMDGDEELFQTLLQIFLGDCPGWLETIQKAAAVEDWSQVQKVAHTLKGAAIAFSAQPTAQAAGQLEAEAEAGCLHTIHRSILRLEEEALRLHRAFTAIECPARP